MSADATAASADASVDADAQALASPFVKTIETYPEVARA